MYNPFLLNAKSESNTTLVEDASLGDDYSNGYIVKKHLKARLEPRSHFKPTIPYAQLISQAIKSKQGNRITLNEIYNYAMEKYSYFKSAGSGWKNSIRHNLSLNKNFVRVPRPANEKGKGAYWTLACHVNDEVIPEKKTPRKVAEEQPQQSYDTYSEAIYYDSHGYKAFPFETEMQTSMFWQPEWACSPQFDAPIFEVEPPAEFCELDWINEDQCEEYAPIFLSEN